jgi:hypothetical protein
LYLVAFFVLGMICGTAAALWWDRDVTGIPRSAWVWVGRNRRAWRRAVFWGWLLGGWPAVFIVFTWWRSTERAELIDLATDVHHRRRAGPSSH